MKVPIILSLTILCDYCIIILFDYPLIAIVVLLP